MDADDDVPEQVQEAKDLCNSAQQRVTCSTNNQLNDYKLSSTGQQIVSRIGISHIRRCANMLISHMLISKTCTATTRMTKRTCEDEEESQHVDDCASQL